jgi:hypothetical protein
VVHTFDLDPQILIAVEVAQVAIAALSKNRACFPEGTLVWVQDEVTGELVAVPIETVQAGQKVWSYDPDTGQWQYCEVAETYELAYDGEFTDVTYIVNGMGPLTETVSATGNHPFWVQSPGSGAAPLTQRPLALHHTGEDAEYLGPNGGRWVQARHLTPGDQLLLKDGRSATVCGLTVRTERTRVYNLNVLELHNYAVGTNGLLVHNARYSGRYADGQKAYRTNVPRDKQNNPIADPNAKGPHSRLQRDAQDESRVFSATEFDGQGNPVRRVDFAGRQGDTLPHSHSYDPTTKGFSKTKDPL